MARDSQKKDGRRKRGCGAIAGYSLTPVVSLFGDLAIAAGTYTYFTTRPNPAAYLFDHRE